MFEDINIKDAEKKLSVLDEFIDAQPLKEDALIAILHKAQEIFGYLPKDLQLYIARKINVPASRIYGVVTFYSYFSEEKSGDFTVNICMGTACFVKGADKLMEEFSKQLGIKTGETTSDGMFTLKDVRCIGACGLAPVVLINDKVLGHVKPEDVAGIIAECKHKKESALC